MVNTELLNNKIKESGKTRQYLAKQCGMTAQSLRLKANNVIDFRSPEVQILCVELDIATLEEKEQIFFADGVSKNGNN